MLAAREINVAVLARDAMNVDPWQSEFDVALAAVRDTTALARSIQQQQLGGPALVKADRSPVTVADFAVQALVAHRLGQEFPKDPLVAGGFHFAAESGWRPDSRISARRGTAHRT